MNGDEIMLRNVSVTLSPSRARIVIVQFCFVCRTQGELIWQKVSRAFLFVCYRAARWYEFCDRLQFFVPRDGDQIAQNFSRERYRKKFAAAVLFFQRRDWVTEWEQWLAFAQHFCRHADWSADHPSPLRLLSWSPVDEALVKGKDFPLQDVKSGNKPINKGRKIN